MSMPTIEEARVERDISMDRVAKKADADGNWTALALNFLTTMVEGRRGIIKAGYAVSPMLNPEDVTDMAQRLSHLEVKELRAWGPVFAAAQRKGIIQRSTVPYQRRRGHGTRSFLWEIVL